MSKYSDWRLQPPYSFEEGASLLIDKPLHLTSFDVVHKVRAAIKRRFKLKDIKVGHGGTLDPLATGLLIICTGKFTKRLNDLLGLDKAYTGTLRMGETTPSYDGETSVDATYPTEHLNETYLQEIAKTFVGDIQQFPPVFSAIKKDGKPAYESARQGQAIELAARPVTIHQFDLTRVALPEVDFYAHCSKGTYIRSLAADFGKAAQSGAWLTALRRVSVGADFHVKDAWQLDDLLDYIAQLP